MSKRPYNAGAVIEEHIRSRYIESFFTHFNPSGTLLDLGCGPRPYRKFYELKFNKTIGADLPDSPFPKIDIDLYCSATDVPLPDQCIDVILCTEVLHDISEPHKFFKECYRLLKPGGSLIISSPFVVPIVDGKFDHYRYTEYGLKYLFESNGFKVRRIDPVGDLFASIITLMVKPSLRFFNKIAKVTRIKIIYSAFNPLLYITVILPQHLYLLFSKSVIIKKLLRPFQYGPIGYVSIAVKDQ